MAYQLWGTLGLIPEGQLVTFERRLLSRVRANLIIAKMGMQNGIPAHGGKSISFRRMDPLLGGSYAAAYNSGGAFASGPPPLTEGTPGAAMDATWVQVLMSVAQYGGYIQYSDVAVAQSIDQIMPETVDNFGEMAAEAVELITRDIVSAGTNVQYASTSTSRGAVGSGQYLKLSETRAVKRTLLRNNVRPVRSEGNRFVLYTHPDNVYDLEGDSTYQNIFQYAGERGPSNPLMAIVPKDIPFGVRLYESSLCRIFASLGLSGADVYGNLMFGEEWFGTVKLDALPMKIYTQDFGSAGTSDPLHQLATVGWKTAWTAGILNQNYGVRLEVASSNKPGGA